MLNSDALKIGLQSDLPQKDKLLLVLASLDGPRDLIEIRQKAAEAGLRIPPRWNPSARLRQAKGLAILTSKGWEITQGGRQHLRGLGFGEANPIAVRIASDLRSELATINEPSARAFVEEAIKCYEAGLHRSAIVMSWIAAVDVLYREVHATHLHAFNQEASRTDPKWKAAKSIDDLSRMKESDFLDRLVALSIIGKNVKNELKQCLDRRNGCGHPNSLKIGPATAAHHLEVLLLNVFQPFS